MISSEWNQCCNISESRRGERGKTLYVKVLDGVGEIINPAHIFAFNMHKKTIWGVLNNN